VAVDELALEVKSDSKLAVVDEACLYALVANHSRHCKSSAHRACR